jgi:hypothetical protein
MDKAQVQVEQGAIIAEVEITRDESSEPFPHEWWIASASHSP